MNSRFFSLPEEKQQIILNAGFHVFSRNTYKKSPTSEIADAAGISKALLFHYFHNKKELYLFLWDTCARIIFSSRLFSTDISHLLFPPLPFPLPLPVQSQPCSLPHRRHILSLPASVEDCRAARLSFPPHFHKRG